MYTCKYKDEYVALGRAVPTLKFFDSALYKSLREGKKKRRKLVGIIKPY